MRLRIIGGTLDVETKAGSVTIEEVLKINGGILNVEVIKGSLSIDEVKGLLKNLSKEQVEEVAIREKISRAGKSVHSSLSNKQDKLNAIPRMPL